MARIERKKIMIFFLLMIILAQLGFILKLWRNNGQKTYEVNLVKINTQKDSVDFPKLKSNLILLEKSVTDLQSFLQSKSIENQNIESLNEDSLSSVVYLAKQSNRYSDYLMKLQNQLMQVPLGMPTNGYVSSHFGKRKNPIPTSVIASTASKKTIMGLDKKSNEIPHLAANISDSTSNMASISAPKYHTKNKVTEKNNTPVEKDQIQFHKGIDIAVSYGSDVFSTAQGTVIFAGQKDGYGYCVIVSHGNGLATLYAHLSDIFVKTNNRVKVNQVIAKSGNSGRSTGPHLHYEVHKNNTPVNPKLFINS